MTSHANILNKTFTFVVVVVHSKRNALNCLPITNNGEMALSDYAVFLFITKMKSNRVNWEVRTKNTDDERGPSCPRGLRVSPSQI